MPPECFNDGRPYSPKPMDIWALGVSIYTLMFGRLPFDVSSHENFLNHIRTGELEIPFGSEHLREVLNRTLDRNPLTRITASELLQLLWFKRDK